MGVLTESKAFLQSIKGLNIDLTRVRTKRANLIERVSFSPHLMGVISTAMITLLNTLPLISYSMAIYKSLKQKSYTSTNKGVRMVIKCNVL